jgi:hypothetical protein
MKDFSVYLLIKYFDIRLLNNDTILIPFFGTKPAPPCDGCRLCVKVSALLSHIPGGANGLGWPRALVSIEAKALPSREKCLQVKGGDGSAPDAHRPEI